ncbi:MAG: hypothetical protein KAH32_07555 [Chlamydiia bacterium]|nr:hypothetical protein [Chlamydiia bacterium]
MLEDFRKAITISASGLFSFAKPNNIRKSYKDAIVLGYKEGVYPFVLAYDQVTMDSEDETYTSLRGKASLASHKGDKVLDLSVKGINEDSRFIKIGSKNIRTLKAYKGTSVPVVVNQYMKRFYDLSVGSKFKLQVTNGLRRYSDKSTKVSKTIEVVGFVNSYSNNEIVSLRKTINKALGYDSKEGFNGIFSGAKEPIALRNVNLYSPSGLYPAFNTFNPDIPNEYKELVSTYLTSRAGKKMLYQSGADITSTPAYPTDVQTFVNMYSNHMYQSTISDVE